MSSELAQKYLLAVLQSHISRGDGPGGSVLAQAFGLGAPAGQALQHLGEDQDLPGGESGGQ